MNDRRKKFRENLHSLYLPIYDSLCFNLPEYFQPVTGYRSPEVQNELFNQGRTTSGIIVTRAKAWQSPHNYGCASDWCIFENNMPVWNVSDKRWKEYEMACARSGAYWGGNFGDFPHNELELKIPWKRMASIRESLLDHDEIYEHIKANMYA